jgi:hypothetical protein
MPEERGIIVQGVHEAVRPPDKPFVPVSTVKCIGGRKYWKEGVLDFPPHASDSNPAMVDGTYRSHFGPKVHCDAVIYGNNNPNVAIALSRINGARVQKPDSVSIFGVIPDYHESLKTRQREFIRTHQHYLDYIHYRSYFDEWDGMIEEAVLHHADPHIKRKLRMDCFREMEEDGAELSRLWLTKVLYKIKKNEYAKWLRIPRMVGDLGVAASLQGFRLTYLLKKAMAAEPIHYSGGVIEFCPKPSPDDLVRIFQQLINPDGRFYFVFFSDDSCYSVRDSFGVVHCYNMDISSCDASHTEAIWEFQRGALPHHVLADYDRLVDQLKLPFFIRDINDPRRKVTLQADGPVLFSGSTLTTVTNNSSNTLLGFSLADDEAISEEEITIACAKVGYVVTVEDCSRDFHLLQFLKHSPVHDTNGRLRALLNLGVLLRASGSCKGDLPGRGDLRARAASFQAALVHGMYPRVHFDLRDRMIESTGVEPDPKLLDPDHFEFTTSATAETFHVSDEEVYARYGCSQLDAQAFQDAFCPLGFGMHYADEVTARILELDYGLPTTFN